MRVRSHTQNEKQHDKVKLLSHPHTHSMTLHTLQCIHNGCLINTLKTHNSEHIDANVLWTGLPVHCVVEHLSLMLRHCMESKQHNFTPYNAPLGSINGKTQNMDELHHKLTIAHFRACEKPVAHGCMCMCV